jgi:hypothetical protein
MAMAKKPRTSAGKKRTTGEQENEFIRLGVISLTILSLVFLLVVWMKY